MRTTRQSTWPRSLQAICQSSSASSVSPQKALDEELFLGLRLLEGIDVAPIETRYNIELRSRIAGLIEQGLVEWQGDRLRLAPGRLAVSNEVFVELMS